MVAKHIKRHISSYNVIERGVNVAAAESNELHDTTQTNLWLI